MVSGSAKPWCYQYHISSDYNNDVCRITSQKPLKLTYLRVLGESLLGTEYANTCPMLLARGKFPHDAHVADYAKPTDGLVADAAFANIYGRTHEDGRVVET
ncbi:hypothetical protein LPJ61_000318 [Coemansia biformis]|uniref:Uncharacterized protein n=1 Tax=Coemansia biformis TaxID=1286918 RepID=A0A9W8D0M7_9FUNG|nr:hypothetical protein LPJ61_000318 [Coemansia biformis]